MFIWEIIIMTTFFLSLMMGRLFYSNICLIECLKEIYFFLFLFRTIELLRLIWLPQFSLLLSGLAFIVSCWWFSLFSIWRLDLFPCLKFYFQECWDGYMIFLYLSPYLTFLSRVLALPTSSFEDLVFNESTIKN